MLYDIELCYFYLRKLLIVLFLCWLGQCWCQYTLEQIWYCSVVQSLPLSRTTEKLYFLLSSQLYSAIVHIGILSQPHREREKEWEIWRKWCSLIRTGAWATTTDLSLVLSQVGSDLSLEELAWAWLTWSWCYLARAGDWRRPGVREIISTVVRSVRGQTLHYGGGTPGGRG